MLFNMKSRDELLSLLQNINNFENESLLIQEIFAIMLKQEKVWRLLFTKEDKNKCRTLIKTFFANMDLLHKPIFKKIIVEWDSKLVALANVPIFYTIDILEKYHIEVKDY